MDQLFSTFNILNGISFRNWHATSSNRRRCVALSLHTPYAPQPPWGLRPLPQLVQGLAPPVSHTQVGASISQAQRAVTSLAGGVNHRTGWSLLSKAREGRHIRIRRSCAGPSGLESGLVPGTGASRHRLGLCRPSRLLLCVSVRCGNSTYSHGRRRRMGGLTLRARTFKRR